MNGLFDMDKPFWKWIGKIPELLLLSFFWFLCCLPVITILPACCALFDAISRNTLTDTRGSFTRFFRSFVRELKKGIPLTLFWLLLGAVISFGGAIVQQAAQAENLPAFMPLLYRLLSLMPAGLLCWLIPLQSRYYFTFGNLHVSALKLFIGRLPSTALMLVVTAALTIVATIHPYVYPLIVLLPGINCVFHGKIVEKSFMLVFPNDYVDGVLVTNEEERQAALQVAAAKQAELENEE